MPTKDKSKKLIKKPRISGNSKEDRMMVLLEDMRDEIKVVAEGHSGLQGSIDSLVEGQTSLQKQIDLLVNGQTDLQRQVSDLNGEMKEGFRLVFDHLFGIEEELKDIKNELEDIRKELRTKVDLKRLALLEQRVAALERRQMIIRDESKPKYKVK